MDQTTSERPFPLPSAPAVEPTVRLRFERGTLLIEDTSAPAVDQPHDRPVWLPEGCVFDGRVGAYRAFAYQYRDVVLGLRRAGVALLDQAPLYAPVAFHLIAAPERPYAHQTEALNAWKKGGMRGVVVLPTGAGKTHVGALAMAAAGRPTVVLVYTRELLRQWHSVLTTTFGMAVGIMGDGMLDADHDLVVATYDSAYRHFDHWGNRWGLVIFDECHRLSASTYTQAAQFLLSPLRLGLSATPEGSDGELPPSLGEVVGPIVYRRTADELQGDTLAPYEIRRIAVDLTDEERVRYEALTAERDAFLRARGIKLGAPGGWEMFLRASAGSAEGRRALLAHHERRLLAKGAETKLAVLAELLQQHPREQVLIFTDDTATAYEVSERFLLPVITHETPARERTEWMSLFRTGKLRALVASHVLDEGIDVPAAAVGVLLSGSGSVREAVQRLGRILRRSPDKRQAILYEVVARQTSEEETARRRGRNPAYQAGQKRMEQEPDDGNVTPFKGRKRWQQLGIDGRSKKVAESKASYEVGIWGLPEQPASASETGPEQEEPEQE
ncbi:MAG TPA: DEAD/DEAH box helicase family protein [Ktedonobacterales bacterium]|nr:DEAD/DEAH box helicase family protein [Ktedonobacterales bacterium]